MFWLRTAPDRTTAAECEAAVKFWNTVPPSTEYCHRPLALVALTTAMPNVPAAESARSMSLISPANPETNADTSLSLEADVKSSSRIVANVTTWLAVTVGRSLTDSTIRLNVAVASLTGPVIVPTSLASAFTRGRLPLVPSHATNVNEAGP